MPLLNTLCLSQVMGIHENTYLLFMWCVCVCVCMSVHMCVCVLCVVPVQANVIIRALACCSVVRIIVYPMCSVFMCVAVLVTV